MTTRPLQAVIFDMDGLLANTEPIAYQATATLLAEDFGITTTEADEAWSTTLVGKSGRAVWQLIVDRFHLPVELPRDQPRLRDRNHAIYMRLLAAGVAPMPGALELLRACHAAGLRLGLASSSGFESITTVLDTLQVRPYFTAITSGQEVPRSKPDPAIYLLACERLGVNPQDAVAIEDSGPGVAAAHAAGLRCLAVPSHQTANHDFSTANEIRSTLVGVTPADLATISW